MPNIRQPRSGSLQFWPRKRANKGYARIRTHTKSSEPGLVGFAGYKVGMTHLIGVETNKHSNKKGEEVSVATTMIECPPMKIASVRFYKNSIKDTKVVKEVFVEASDKNLAKKINLPKKAHGLGTINPEDYDDVRVLVYTQPVLTTVEKKKPEVFELGIGGNSVKEKLDYVKEKLGKDITVEDVFKEGDYVDFKVVTKGKGFQGPVKRFGVSIRQAKSEKAIRNPGSLGPWSAQGHIMYRVAHAGKMGFHQRTEYNKQILRVAAPEEVAQDGGHLKYGTVKNKVLLIKGSVAGTRKRVVIMEKAQRLKKPKTIPTFLELNKNSKQGN